MDGITQSVTRERDPWRQVRIGIAALGAVLIGGTVAYRLVGLGWFDSFYQTLITISTVGYSEVGSQPDTAYRLVTSAVIILGVGVTLYTLGFAFEALMAGTLTDYVGRTRLQRTLDQLKGHVILCGWGQVGQSIFSALRNEGVEVVVVDRRPDLADQVKGLAVVGEATNDESLSRAGVEHARALVVALDSDADNMYVTLSGRSLNPSIFIVTRANSAAASPKLEQAGADRVVNPHEIGGNRMAAFVFQPNVADFLGVAMRDDRLEVRLREFVVRPHSKLDGSSLDEAGLLAATGVTMLALKRADGSFVHHPPRATTVEAGDVPIVLGTPEQHRALRMWLERADPTKS